MVRCLCAVVTAVVIASVVFLVLLAVGIGVTVARVKKHLMSSEMAKMLWKINYRELEFLNDKVITVVCLHTNVRLWLRANAVGVWAVCGRSPPPPRTKRPKPLPRERRTWPITKGY